MTCPLSTRDSAEGDNASAQLAPVDGYSRESDTESVKSKASNVFLDVSMRVEDLVQQTRKQQQQTRNFGGSSSCSLGAVSSLGGDSATIVSSTLEGLFEDSLALASQRKVSRRRQLARAGRSRSAPKIGGLNLPGEQEDSLLQTQLRVPTIHSRTSVDDHSQTRDTWHEDLSDDGSFAVPMTRPSCGSFHGSRHSLLSFDSRSTSSLYSHQESLDDSSVSSFAVGLAN
eukprot:CAMPEP_0117039956 /NCGR_PEP_ID=MMETSP0472-20121206/27997_1 /TAXON_ID=693140 ORGANISM="Tiarina fusus, Strain LIS" /NCGR_SAMPLE_ID=MMETSP0472 /ASSEMBLY_ACC=CAM_ASM_000603 /LENGTH=227 /DNA_ID=CAMNT_0004750565 /DNA_START=131 /DNA_END=814 /DNA_ORIENTATION=+